MRPTLSVDAIVRGVKARDRAVLARAITLVESELETDRAVVHEVLEALAGSIGGAIRVGISGVPGVGKSTFVDALGTLLGEQGLAVAVLAIDPSSTVSGGSILGDKTRMTRLARDPQAFVRPSPSGGTLGGVARKTMESMWLCEAAGFDVVLIETVGVGQSETLAAEMVDFFIVLLLPHAGDELQGIKRGILEVADLVAINKTDLVDAAVTSTARHQCASALRWLRGEGALWDPPTRTCSARQDEGLGAIWADVLEHRRRFIDSGELARKRAAQTVRWMWRTVEDRVMHLARSDEQVRALLAVVEPKVRSGEMLPSVAADALVDALRGSLRPRKPVRSF